MRAAWQRLGQAIDYNRFAAVPHVSVGERGIVDPDAYRDIRVLGVTTLGLLTLMLLFAATWIIYVIYLPQLVEQAIRTIRVLERYDLEFVEQPVRPGDVEAAASLVAVESAAQRVAAAHPMADRPAVHPILQRSPASRPRTCRLGCSGASSDKLASSKIAVDQTEPRDDRHRCTELPDRHRTCRGRRLWRLGAGSARLRRDCDRSPARTGRRGSVGEGYASPADSHEKGPPAQGGRPQSVETNALTERR